MAGFAWISKREVVWGRSRWAGLSGGQILQGRGRGEAVTYGGNILAMKTCLSMNSPQIRCPVNSIFWPRTACFQYFWKGNRHSNWMDKNTCGLGGISTWRQVRISQENVENHWVNSEVTGRHKLHARGDDFQLKLCNCSLQSLRYNKG